MWPRQVSALLVLVCAVAVPGGGRAAADGAGNGGLELRVSVNSRPGTDALRPGIRVGDPVHKVYRLINHTGADLYGVRVIDPALPPGASITCSGRPRVAMLRGISSTTCEAETRARGGVQTGEVTAVGRIPSLRLESRARALAGYRGVGGVLTLGQDVEVERRSAVVTYTVGNQGNRTLYDVRVGDALPGAGRIDCGGDHPVVPRIAPGDSASCRSTVRGKPGDHTSRGRATAGDRTRTLGRSGELLPSPTLTARSSVRFTLRDAPVEAVAPPDREADEPSTPAPPSDAGSVGPRPQAAAAFALTPPEVPLAPPALLAPIVPPAPPGAVPPGAVPPPAAVPPEAVPPGAVPPGAVAPPPQADGGPAGAATGVTPERPQRAAQDVPLSERFYRPGHGPTGIGLVTILFLVVLPAVLAAALLGSRLK